MANVMSSTARTQPTRRWKSTPWLIGKYIFRLRTSSSNDCPLADAFPLVGAAVGSLDIGGLLSHVHPAGDAVVGPDGLEHRPLGLRAANRVGAARCERAARRQRDQVRRQPVDGDQALA